MILADTSGEFDADDLRPRSLLFLLLLLLRLRPDIVQIKIYPKGRPLCFSSGGAVDPNTYSYSDISPDRPRPPHPNLEIRRSTYLEPGSPTLRTHNIER